MPKKCCNYTDNTSPTLDQVKAIETTWNKFINDYFKAVDDKYPSTDLTIFSSPVSTILRNSDGTVKKNGNGQPMFKVEDDDGDMLELAREELNALRLNSLICDTDDTKISDNATPIVDKQGVMLGMAMNEHPLNDITLPDPDDATKTIVAKGITTYISEGKLTLRTHEGHFRFGDYKKEELIFTD